MGFVFKTISLETGNIHELVSFLSKVLDWDIQKDALTGESFCECNGIRFQFPQGRKSKSGMTSFFQFEFDSKKEFSNFIQKVDFFIYRNPKVKIKFEKSDEKLCITDMDGRKWHFILNELKTLPPPSLDTSDFEDKIH